MKNTLFILLIIIGLNSFGQENTIASCCVIGGRCTGSVYCSACTNCKYCKHCAKNGGSCGVCSVGNTRSYKPRKKKIRSRKLNYTRTRKKQNTNTIYGKFKINNYINAPYLYVTSTVLHLRKGAGSRYKIIAKLTKDTKLIYIKKQGNWIKIKVVESGLIGYVYYKYVL